jgi:hemolysin activation/secretion protein
MCVKTCFLFASLLCVASVATAQQFPSAGGQLQQIPALPDQRPAIPEIRVERPGAAVAPTDAGPAFVVSALRVSGQTVYSEADLLAVTGFTPGATLDLAGLRAMAAKITDFYNRHGYFVAQAYLAAQTLTGGSVTITVVEGHYGQIALHNTSRASNRAAEPFLAGIDRGDIVANAPLERRLLLLSDLPGVAVKSTLVPGSDVGTSDLLVDLLPARRVTGSIDADDAGNRYTGYFRLGGSVNLNEPFGIGDVASVRGLVSNEGLTYIRGSYQAPVGKVTVGVAYARLDYRLHREFASLGAHGSAGIASLYASYPLVRSYNRNLTLLGGVDYKVFEDYVDSIAARSDKHSVVGYVGLSGDSRDTFGGGGADFFSAIVSGGSLDIRSPDVRAIDALTTGSDGGFAKLNLAAGRTQTLSGPLSLYVAARGQIASKNLDISEKMELGGISGVRAYPEGEAYGDDGYIATAELRFDLLGLRQHVPGTVQLFGFIDNGGVTFNHDRYFTGRNSTNLTGGGAGVSWAAPGNYLVRVSYAHRIGTTRVTSQPDTSGQVWVQLSKLF